MNYAQPFSFQELVSLWEKRISTSSSEANKTVVYSTKLIEKSSTCKVGYFVNEWKICEDQTVVNLYLARVESIKFYAARKKHFSESCTCYVYQDSLNKSQN